MVLERVAIQVILMIEFAALKNVYHPFQFWEKSPVMDLFFLTNWQTMLLNVCDLMLSFLRRHDMLGTCDFFAEKAGCS